MKINELKLQEYVNDDEIYVFENEAEYLEFVNTERRMFWSFEHSNDFKTFEETKAFGGEYLLHHNGKYYWIAFEHALDIYEK